MRLARYLGQLFHALTATTGASLSVAIVQRSVEPTQGG
jgi:hypothetical protein